MLNSVALMGRMVKDPELRHTQSGTAVTSFTLAVERDYAPEGGNREVDFIDCVAWKGTGEFVSKYFSKGSMAAVNGRLQLRDWTDKEGNKRRSAEVVAESVYFCESKKKDAQSAGKARSAVQAQQAVLVTAEDFPELDDDDGELPW